MNPDLNPLTLISALLSLPLFSLILAVLISLGLSLRRSPVEIPARYIADLRAVGVVAIAVVVAFALENIVRGYVLKLVDVVDWWRYPTPQLAAIVGLAIVAIIVASGSSAPSEPVLPSTRRSWLSFGPRLGLIGSGLTMLVLVTVTITAGAASSADTSGRFIYLDLAAPNTTLEPIRPWFFGWSYGIPVLISTALLCLATWAVLSRNSIRSFSRAQGMLAEQNARASLASAAVSIAAGATLLTLAGALRFIARSGTISQVTVGNDGPYELVWRYASVAAVGGWIAPVLEIVGFTLLLLVAGRVRAGRQLTELLADEVAA